MERKWLWKGLERSDSYIFLILSSIYIQLLSMTNIKGKLGNSNLIIFSRKGDFLKLATLS